MAMAYLELPGVALITGAASGIGRGTALAFTKAGCTKMFLGDINLPGLNDTLQKCHSINANAEIESFHLDISSEQSVQDFVDGCVTRFGRIDYACNIAGIVPPRTPIVDTTPEVYDKVIEVNTIGTFLCHRAQLRQMLTQSCNPSKGSIVSVSSMAGLNASPGVSPYSSTKFAIIGMVKTDAYDYGPWGIRVNAVCPGFTDTEALHAMSTPEQRTALARGVPLQRLGIPEEVGKAIVFLSSEMSSYINGVALPVDGGALIQRQG